MRRWRVSIGCLLLFMTLNGCSAKQVEVTEHFLVVAHRGASAYAPEHTLASYELAINQRADYIDIDLQMTADNVLIAMHDEKLERTTNGNGTVNSYTLSEIKKLDAGSWFNREHLIYSNLQYDQLEVLTLEEIIEHFGDRISYYIETKSPSLYPGMEEELLAILSKYDLINGESRPSVIIQSFSSESLKRIHKRAPSIPLFQLLNKTDLRNITEHDFQRIRKYAVGIGPNAEGLNEELVKSAREAKLEVHPYTVDNQKEFSRLVEWGITGVFTNKPDKITELIQ